MFYHALCKWELLCQWRVRHAAAKSKIVPHRQEALLKCIKHHYSRAKGLPTNNLVLLKSNPISKTTEEVNSPTFQQFTLTYLSNFTHYLVLARKAKSCFPIISNPQLKKKRKTVIKPVNAFTRKNIITRKTASPTLKNCTTNTQKHDDDDNDKTQPTNTYTGDKLQDDVLSLYENEDELERLPTPKVDRRLFLTSKGRNNSKNNESGHRRKRQKRRALNKKTILYDFHLFKKVTTKFCHLILPEDWKRLLLRVLPKFLNLDKSWMQCSRNLNNYVKIR